MRPSDLSYDARTLAMQPNAGLNMQPYANATYQYWCYRVPGTALTTAHNAVVRVTIATGAVEHALPAGFHHLATDLATVAALTYS